MVFAIIRVVVVSSYSQEPDETWLYMWSSIEQTVCMLPWPSHLFTVRSHKLTVYFHESHHSRMSRLFSVAI